MAKNELLPFADGEDANVLPTNQWEALTDILENGFQSGIARSEQVNRVLAQGAVASYVLGQLIVDQLNKDATLDKSALYQNLILALQENAKDACLPLSGGNVTGNLTVQSKNVVCSVNGSIADIAGNVSLAVSDGTVVEKINTTVNVKRGANARSTVTISDLTPLKPLYVVLKRSDTFGSVRSFSFVSNGVALKTTSISQEKDLSLGRDNARWHIVVPTGTSVALTVTGSYDDSLSYRVIAYQ